MTLAAQKYLKNLFSIKDFLEIPKIDHSHPLIFIYLQR